MRFKHIECVGVSDVGSERGFAAGAEKSDSQNARRGQVDERDIGLQRWLSVIKECANMWGDPVRRTWQ